MKNVIELCKTNKDESASNKQKNPTNSEELLLENRPMTELFVLIEQHQKHLKLLKDNDMLSEEKKVSIISEIEDIFEIVNSRTTRNKKRSADYGDLNSFNATN